MPVILGGSVGRDLKNGEESISSSCPLVMAVGASSMGLGVTLSALGCMDLRLHHSDYWVIKFYLLSSVLSNSLQLIFHLRYDNFFISRHMIGIIF